MKKLEKMNELTNEDLSKVTGGCAGASESTSWNTLGCTGETGDEGYDSCCDDDDDVAQ